LELIELIIPPSSQEGRILKNTARRSRGARYFAYQKKTPQKQTFEGHKSKNKNLY
jgi:hypothetical protein